MRSDLKKLDFFTLETSKNHLIRNFLRNGRVRVKILCVKNIIYLTKPALLFNISSIFISAIAIFVGYTRVYHMPYPYSKKNVEKLIKIIKEHKELQSHKLDEYTKQRAERQRETKEPVFHLKIFITKHLIKNYI